MTVRGRSEQRAPVTPRQRMWAVSAGSRGSCVRLPMKAIQSMSSCPHGASRSCGSHSAWKRSTAASPSGRLPSSSVFGTRRASGEVVACGWVRASARARTVAGCGAGAGMSAEPCRRGQGRGAVCLLPVLLISEAHRAAGARDWRESDPDRHR